MRKSFEINMKNAHVVLTIALDLSRVIAGVRLLSEHEYSNLNVVEQRGPVCFLIRKAVEGNHIKANMDLIACNYGRFAIGVEKPHQRILDGEGYGKCGLYKDEEVARSIAQGFKYLDSKHAGLEAGPVSSVDKPDIIEIVCNTRQAMRLFQGYAYNFGIPKNLISIGNQAGCSDMIAKPIYNDDINISFFCRGARDYGRFGDGEIGVAIPVNQYVKVAEGVFNTIDPYCNIKEKRILTKKFANAGLECEFDEQASYGNALIALDQEIQAERSY